VALLSPASASAANYYVSLTGSDTNPGTESAPFRTFAKGVSTMVAGDTLLISGGTYLERISVSKSGTSGSPLTIKSVAGQKVVIDQQKKTDRGIDVSGSYINISGIEVKNSCATTSDGGCYPLGTTGQVGSNSGTCVNLLGQYITISDLIVNNCQGHGIYTDGKHNVIRGNKVFLTNIGNKLKVLTSQWGSAIKLKVGADDILIENNDVYQNYGEGICITRAINTTVRNNRSHDLLLFM
jgi:parallel beta-helix repeat protein